MTSIVHLMGPTCVGKSTLIEALRNLDGVGTVEVGKMMRAKYSDPSSRYYVPDYFKGQAAPLHTQEEAFTMYMEGVIGAFGHGKKLVFVDGQPRDVQQARDIMDGLWKPPIKIHFVALWVDQEIREARASRDRSGEALELAKQRMVGDYKNLAVVLAELGLRNQKVTWLRSDGDVKNMAQFLVSLFGSFSGGVPSA